MQWRLASAFAAAALLSAGSARATRAPLVVQERDYDCKTIASRRDVDLDDVAPQMNAWGQVAFGVDNQATGLQEIRVGHGDLDGHGRPKTSVVADEVRQAGAIILLGEPVIQDGGFVVFSAFQQIIPGGTMGGQGILRVPYFQRVDRSPNPVVANIFWVPPGPYDGDFGTVSTNSLATLLFQLLGSPPGAGLYVGSTQVAKGGTGAIAGLIDGSEVIDPGTDSFYGFRATLNNFGTAVFLDGTQRDSVSSSPGEGLDGLSVNGHVVPIASYVRYHSATPTWTIEFESDLGHQTLVDAAVDPFFQPDIPFTTSLNLWSEVAFVATPGAAVDTLADASRLFVVHDTELWRVHCRNTQEIFGSPILGVDRISSRAINNYGQIAFLAAGVDGVMIVRADPLPGQSARPTSCAGLDDGTPCDNGNRIAIASCQAQVCTGDPSGGFPASCVGLPDNSSCQAADPELIGTCANQECVGRSPEAPEPEASALADGALAALLLLRAGPGAKRATPSRRVDTSSSSAPS